MTIPADSNDITYQFTLRGKHKRWSGHLKKAIHTIERLICTAVEIYQDHPQRAVSHIKKARKIAMQYNIRIPRRLKRLFCPSCYHPLLPGYSAKTRIYRGKVIISCLTCRRYIRIPLAEKTSSQNRHINK